MCVWYKSKYDPCLLAYHLKSSVIPLHIKLERNGKGRKSTGTTHTAYQWKSDRAEPKESIQVLL